MEAIMLSVKPEWCAKILNGEKTIEIRKTKPSCELPIKVYIYCTKDKKYEVAPFRFVEGWFYKKFDDNTHYCCGCTANMGKCINSKVVAEFTLNKITTLNQMPHLKRTGLILSEGAMDMGQFNSYGGSYAWHIDNLKIYDSPKELSEFCYPCPRWYLLKELCYREKGGKLTFCKYNDIDNSCCKAYLTRPPQSWCYVDELEGK